jgi:hypothetical protein
MTGVRVDVVILSCAVSAGIHGALVPDHFDEGTGAGAGFIAATVLLAGLVVGLTQRPQSRFLLASAVLLLAGLIGSYLLAVTTGVPVLHPDVEQVDILALFTKAIEAAGIVAASTLLWRRPVFGLALHPKGT